MVIDPYAPRPHNELYECRQCGHRWRGPAGPQGDAERGCLKCGSLYLEWLTWEPNRFPVPKSDN